MTEFEKWWDKNKHIFISTDEKLVAKDVWKAALEWAKDELKNNVNGFFKVVKELENLKGQT